MENVVTVLIHSTLLFSDMSISCRLIVLLSIHAAFECTSCERNIGEFLSARNLEVHINLRR